MSSPLVSDFPLKGDRSYIHGTDIYDWCIEILPGFCASESLARVTLEFHRMAKSQLVAVERTAASDDYEGKEPCATFRAKFAEENVSIDFYESGRAPAERVPYDEAVISDQSLIDGEQISFDGVTAYTPIETLIPMTKALHHSLFGPTEKWVFAKIDGARFLPSPAWSQRATIRLKQHLARRFSVSEIILDGQLAGQIFFSVR